MTYCSTGFSKHHLCLALLENHKKLNSTHGDREAVISGQEGSVALGQGKRTKRAVLGG